MHTGFLHANKFIVIKRGLADDLGIFIFKEDLTWVLIMAYASGMIDNKGLRLQIKVFTQVL